MSAFPALPGVEFPVIQAPMAGVQDSRLAIAVGRAGGLGSLPCAMLSPELLRQQLQTLRDSGLRAFNLNFFCHEPPRPDLAREAAWRGRLASFYEEMALDPGAMPEGSSRAPFSESVADIVEPFAPAVVSFHFGLPSQALLGRVKSWGSQVWSSATSVDEARWLQAHGADAVIAQGAEAGGHRGMFLETDPAQQTGLFALLPRIVDAVSVPVIAAGGIADTRGVAAARALGASAVQVGTAFLLCPESTTSKVHRAALASESSGRTVLTNVFTGRPARGLVNRLMRELGAITPLAPAFPLASAAVAPLRAAAEKAGSGDFTSLWSGQNPSGCRAVPAAEIVRSLGEAW